MRDIITDVEPPPAWSIVRLAENTSGDASPRIAGDLVVWSGIGSVSVHDLSSRETHLLATPGLLYSSVRVAGRLVTWITATGPYTMSAWAFVVGLDAHPVRISGTGNVSTFAETDGRWVVWAEGAPRDVFVYDSATEKTLRITDDGVPDDWPQLGGGLVVWTRGDDAQAEIYAYDIIAQRTWRLTDNAEHDGSPFTDGARVVWLTHDGHDTEVYLYDVVSGETVALTDDDVMETRARVVGGRVLYSWYSSSDDRLIQDGGFTLLGPRGDTALGRLYEVSGQGPLFAALGDERVAWLQPTDESGTPVDLVVGDLEDLRTSRVSANTLGAGLPDLSGGRVVWESRVPLGPTGSRWDLFLAAPAGDPVVPPSPLTFIDVAAGHRYGEAIRAMAAAGLVNGYALAPLANEFRPDRPVWRAQFAKMVVGALDIPVDETMHTRFTDMPPDPSDDLYPNQYIAAAYFAGITRGVTATTFEPWSPISRAQLVTMVVRGLSGDASASLEAPPAAYAGSLGDFDPAHAGNMRLSEFNGLLDGLAGFGPAWDPWAPATRGEVAQILWNATR